MHTEDSRQPRKSSSGLLESKYGIVECRWLVAVGDRIDFLLCLGDCFSECRREFIGANQIPRRHSAVGSAPGLEQIAATLRHCLSFFLCLYGVTDEKPRQNP